MMVEARAFEVRIKEQRASRTLVLGLLVIALVFAGLLLTAKPAHAAEFTVNNTGDEPDVSAGDGVCDVSTRGDLGAPPCTLRAAVEEANAASGADKISFNIPDDPNVSGDEVKTIRPGSALPDITAPVTIDGYSQPGASENTIGVEDGYSIDTVLKIELDGTNAGLVDALQIEAPNSVVRGLVINRFTHAGIFLQSKGGRVEGNFIGTDPSGNQALGNGVGTWVWPSGGSSIGGTSPGARNLISGNRREGVIIDEGVGNKIQGNLIGVQQRGTFALGNGSYGVWINGGSSNNTVGGVEPEAANTIAYHRVSGVLLGLGTGNRILGNSIFGNWNLGIDLGGDDTGREQDSKDPDTGPNNLQNFPVLAGYDSSSNSVTGTLNSNPSVKKKRRGKTRIVRSYFTIQFFLNPSGEQEGKFYIGQKTVATNLSGNASFSFTPSLSQLPGGTITATATRKSTGDTSEFSDPLTVG